MDKTEFEASLAQSDYLASLASGIVHGLSQVLVDFAWQLIVTGKAHEDDVLQAMQVASAHLRAQNATAIARQCAEEVLSQFELATSCVELVHEKHARGIPLGPPPPRCSACGALLALSGLDNLALPFGRLGPGQPDPQVVGVEPLREQGMRPDT